MSSKTVCGKSELVYKYKPAGTARLLLLQLKQTIGPAVLVFFLAVFIQKNRQPNTIVSIVLLVLSFFGPILVHISVLHFFHRIFFSLSEVRHQIGRRIVMRIPWHQLKAAGILTTNTGKQYVYLCGAGKKRILSIGQKNAHRWGKYISQDAIARMKREEDGLWKLCLAYYLCTMGGEADEPTFLLKMDDEILEAIRRYSPLLPLDLNLFG